MFTERRQSPRSSPGLGKVGDSFVLTAGLRHRGANAVNNTAVVCLCQRQTEGTFGLHPNTARATHSHSVQLLLA